MAGDHLYLLTERDTRRKAARTDPHKCRFYEVRTCKKCKLPFMVLPKRGRYPQLCLACKEGRSQYPSCPVQRPQLIVDAPTSKPY